MEASAREHLLDINRNFKKYYEVMSRNITEKVFSFYRFAGYDTANGNVLHRSIELQRRMHREELDRIDEDMHQGWYLTTDISSFLMEFTQWFCNYEITRTEEAIEIWIPQRSSPINVLEHIIKLPASQRIIAGESQEAENLALAFKAVTKLVHYAHEYFIDPSRRDKGSIIQCANALSDIGMHLSPIVKDPHKFWEKFTFDKENRLEHILDLEKFIKSQA